MPPRKESPSARSDEVTELRDEVAELKNYVRVLVNAMDDIREELQYLNINGLRTREPLPPAPVLKRMAADPCADDWNERLIIARGEGAEHNDSMRSGDDAAIATPSSVGKPLAGKLFDSPGDQRQLF